jgi:hypothetical protein
VFVAWLQLIAVLREGQVLANGLRLDGVGIFAVLHCTNETNPCNASLM